MYAHIDYIDSEHASLGNTLFYKYLLILTTSTIAGWSTVLTSTLWYLCCGMATSQHAPVNLFYTMQCGCDRFVLDSH